MDTKSVSLLRSHRQYISHYQVIMRYFVMLWQVVYRNSLSWFKLTWTINLISTGWHIWCKSDQYLANQTYLTATNRPDIALIGSIYTHEWRHYSDSCELGSHGVHQSRQIWARSEWDWTKMGQILDFFKSDVSTFWLSEPKCTEIWSENIPDLSYLVPICPTLNRNLPSP